MYEKETEYESLVWRCFEIICTWIIKKDVLTCGPYIKLIQSRDCEGG